MKMAANKDYLDGYKAAMTIARDMSSMLVYFAETRETKTIQLSELKHLYQQLNKEIESPSGYSD